MRGIQDVVEGPVVRCGITPAHAGNTVSMARAAGADLGSPPRMRGIPDADVAASPALGITPAHAGNTSLVKLSSNRCRDHPRACGEYCCLWGIRPYRKGSPPRMRGIPVRSGISGRLIGITPAHAGNTGINRRKHHGRRDHPRACGEYSIHHPTIGDYLGSPPRMRGIHLNPRGLAALSGITPAHAGNTCWHICRKRRV